MEKVTISIAGVMSEEYIMCVKCAKSISQSHPDVVAGFDEKLLQQTQWNLHLEKIAATLKGEFYNHTTNHIVYVNGSEYIGDAHRFLEWALRNFRYVDETPSIEYFKLAYNAFNKDINETDGRSYVYMQIFMGQVDQMKNEIYEMVVIELFDSLCPKTCQNFRELCTGTVERNGKKLTYIDTEFDRIVPGSFVQGGNLRKTLGAGQDSYSIFEEGEFADENFSMKHTEPGLLGMCKRNDYANTNECQFYVTLGGPLSFMDNKNVIFGRVINGMKTFRTIEGLETYNQKPNQKIQVKRAGKYQGY